MTARGFALFLVVLGCLGLWAGIALAAVAFG